MAKPKVVKQAEAMVRNIAQFRRDLAWYKTNAPGGEMYIHTKILFGKKEADEDAIEPEKKMLASAARAGVDRDGNPLVKQVNHKSNGHKQSKYKHDGMDAHCIIGVVSNPEPRDSSDDMDLHWCGYQ